MLKQLFPERIDNTYRGHKAALWFFGAVLLLRLTMSFNCIFNGYDVATGADGIPLQTFSHAAMQTVLYLFAAWALAQLMLSIIGVLALVRYRSAIPFLFALLLFDLFARKLSQRFLPVVTVGAPPAIYVNLFLFTTMFAGLALSLWVPTNRLQTQE